MYELLLDAPGSNRVTSRSRRGRVSPCISLPQSLQGPARPFLVLKRFCNCEIPVLHQSKQARNESFSEYVRYG